MRRLLPIGLGLGLFVLTAAPVSALPERVEARAKSLCRHRLGGSVRLDKTAETPEQYRVVCSEPSWLESLLRLLLIYRKRPQSGQRHAQARLTAILAVQARQDRYLVSVQRIPLDLDREQPAATRFLMEEGRFDRWAEQSEPRPELFHRYRFEIDELLNKTKGGIIP